MAMGQFTAGGHDAGMLGIADQQLVALLPRQSPEGQNTAGTDVFGEGQSLWSYPQPGGETLTQFRDGAAGVGEDRLTEGTQLLDCSPGLLNGD